MRWFPSTYRSGIEIQMRAHPDRGGNKNPLGLEWSEVLYYAPKNRAEFGADA